MYLLRVIDEKNAAGVPRVRCVECQTLNGEPLDTEVNVQTNPSMRYGAAPGTIFEVDTLEEKKTLHGVKFYHTSDDLRLHKK